MRLLRKRQKRRGVDGVQDLFGMKTTRTTLLGGEVTVEGDLECAGNVRISGRVIGRVKSPGMVFIGKGASVRGDIACASSVIHGSVDGQISVSGKVELGRSSRVKGDIIAGSLAIEREAFISGNAVSRFSQLHLFTEKRKEASVCFDHME